MLEPFGAAVLDPSQLGDGVRVLDVGCGAGALTLAAAHRIGHAGHATGVDISRPLLDLARDRAEHMGAHNSRAAYSGRTVIPTLDVDLLLVHSTDDERYPFGDAQEVAPRCRRAQLLAMHGLTHRRTARDPEVVTGIADFVTT